MMEKAEIRKLIERVASEVKGVADLDADLLDRETFLEGVDALTAALLTVLED